MSCSLCQGVYSDISVIPSIDTIPFWLLCWDCAKKFVLNSTTKQIPSQCTFKVIAFQTNFKVTNVTANDLPGAIEDAIRDIGPNPRHANNPKQQRPRPDFSGGNALSSANRNNPFVTIPKTPRKKRVARAFNKGTLEPRKLF